MIEAQRQNHDDADMIARFYLLRYQKPDRGDDALLAACLQLSVATCLGLDRP